MAFTHRQFDVEIERAIDPRRLSWPSENEAGEDGEDAGFGGNRHYQDLRFIGWPDVDAALKHEELLIARIAASSDPETEAGAIEAEREELFDAGEDDPLWRLDLGVASLTFAVAAIGGVPFTSCNAGAFGAGHTASHPFVAAMIQPHMVELILGAAERAGAGVIGEAGEIILYARDIPAMMAFARAIRERAP